MWSKPTLHVKGHGELLLWIEIDIEILSDLTWLTVSPCASLPYSSDLVVERGRALVTCVPKMIFPHSPGSLRHSYYNGRPLSKVTVPVTNYIQSLNFLTTCLFAAGASWEGLAEVDRAWTFCCSNSMMSMISSASLSLSTVLEFDSQGGSPVRPRSCKD